MKRPVAHSLNSTWFWIELPENCCEPLKFIMKYISIQFCERPGHGRPFHALHLLLLFYFFWRTQHILGKSVKKQQEGQIWIGLAFRTQQNKVMARPKGGLFRYRVKRIHFKMQGFGFLSTILDEAKLKASNYYGREMPPSFNLVRFDLKKRLLF